MPLLIAFIWASLFNYGFGLVASRILGPGDFGLLAFAQSILLLAGFILQSGLPWTLTRDLVLAPARERGALLRGALIANVGAAGVMAVAIGALYVLGPLQRGLEAVPILIAVIAALPLIAVVAVMRAAAQGVEAFGRVGLIQATEVTIKTAAGLVLAAVGFGALGAVAGFAVGALVAAAVGIAVIAPRIPLMARSIKWPRAAAAGPMFGALLGLALILNLDLQAMKLLVADRAAAGQYQAAIILANAPYFLVSSAIVPVLFTRLSGGGSLTDTRGRVADALRIGVGLIVPIELLLVAIPDVVLGLLFPSAYAGAAPILRLMAIGNGALITVTVIAAAFQAVSRASEVSRVLLAIVPFELVSLALVVPRFGATGAVLSFDAASLVAAVALGVMYATRAGVSLPALARWTAQFFVALLIAGAVALALLAVAGVGWAVVGAGLVYYGLALGTGIVPSGRVRHLFRPGRPGASAGASPAARELEPPPGHSRPAGEQ